LALGGARTVCFQTTIRPNNNSSKQQFVQTTIRSNNNASKQQCVQTTMGPNNSGSKRRRVQITAAGAGQPQDRSAEPLIRMGDSWCGRHEDCARSCRYCDQHNVPRAPQSDHPFRAQASAWKGRAHALWHWPARCLRGREFLSRAAVAQLRQRLPWPQLDLPHLRQAHGARACWSVLP